MRRIDTTFKLADGKLSNSLKLHTIDTELPLLLSKNPMN